MDKKKRRLVIVVPVVGALVFITVALTIMLVAVSAPSTHAESIEPQSGHEDAMMGEEIAGEGYQMGEPSDNPDCDFHDWIGQPVDEPAVRVTGRPYRVLAPDSMATMDYNPERINLKTDASGIVTSVECN